MIEEVTGYQLWFEHALYAGAPATLDTWTHMHRTYISMHAHYIYMQEQEKENDRFSSLIFNHTKCPTVVPKMLNSQIFHVFVQHLSEWQTQPCVWKYKNWKRQYTKGGWQTWPSSCPSSLNLSLKFSERKETRGTSKKMFSSWKWFEDWTQHEHSQHRPH